MNANAAISAAMRIGEELLDATVEITGAERSGLIIEDGEYSKKDPAVGVSYLEALHKSQEDRGALVCLWGIQDTPYGEDAQGSRLNWLQRTLSLLM